MDLLDVKQKWEGTKNNELFLSKDSQAFKTYRNTKTDARIFFQSIITDSEPCRHVIFHLFLKGYK